MVDWLNIGGWMVRLSGLVGCCVVGVWLLTVVDGYLVHGLRLVWSIDFGWWLVLVGCWLLAGYLLVSWSWLDVGCLVVVSWLLVLVLVGWCDWLLAG